MGLAQRTAGLVSVPHWLQSSDDPRDGGPLRKPRASRTAAEHEDLPYKVELWDELKGAVELTLAVTVSASIGYAAYYAATREYPDRYITLRHNKGIVSRWNGPTH